jgi:beta-mannosidase
MGTLYWQLNDCWPGISWSSIDHFGNWKALHYEAKEAFENILISFERIEDEVGIYIVNDQLNTIDEILKVRLIDFHGNELWNSSKAISVPSNSSMLVESFSIDRMEEIQWNQVMLEAHYGDHSSTYFFAKPKNLALENGDLEIEIQKVAEGFSIGITSSILQKNIMLMTPTDGHFSDNYFDLIANEKRTILFQTESSSIEELTYKSINQLQTE